MILLEPGGLIFGSDAGSKSQGASGPDHWLERNVRVFNNKVASANLMASKAMEEFRLWETALRFRRRGVHHGERM